MIKLCYKSYQYKMSLGAMKQFKAATGKDLWCTLLQYMECWTVNAGDPALIRLRKLYEMVDFDTASHLFHSLIRAEDKAFYLEEIEDGMFKVGWMSTDRPSDMSEPYPLVLLQVAHEINEQFTVDVSKVKK